jgi:hypothetical protein
MNMKLGGQTETLLDRLSALGLETLLSAQRPNVGVR